MSIEEYCDEFLQEIRGIRFALDHLVSDENPRKPTLISDHAIAGYCPLCPAENEKTNEIAEPPKLIVNREI